MCLSVKESTGKCRIIIVRTALPGEIIVKDDLLSNCFKHASELKCVVCICTWFDNNELHIYVLGQNIFDHLIKKVFFIKKLHSKSLLLCIWSKSVLPIAVLNC